MRAIGIAMGRRGRGLLWVKLCRSDPASSLSNLGP